MSRANDLGAAWPEIATRAELLKRLDARAAPVPAPILAPNGASIGGLSKLEMADNEKRIAQLDATLDMARERLERGHAFARLEGQAKTQFQRSR